MKPITVLLTEDHSLVRDGLLALLGLEADIEVVGVMQNGWEAVAVAPTILPDVIVMDISMPLLDGLEASRQILQASPSTRILILTANDDDAYVDQARALGVSGYVLKQAAARVLPDAIREVHKGNTFFQPDRRTQPS